MVVIVNYGLGNLASVKNMLKKIGVKSVISDNNEDIVNADILILPGVGHFAKGMEGLKEKALVETLNKKVLEDKTPILGICLGMQLMTNYSEEGESKGLGWIDAKTTKFRLENDQLKVPHMGWTDVELRKEKDVLKQFDEIPRFYFVHSYKVMCNDETDILAVSNYGGEFHCAFRKDNIWGTQFHPEKSHKFGMQFLKYFFKINS